MSSQHENEGLLLRAIGPNGAIVSIDEVLADGPPKRRRKCTCYSCEHPLVAHQAATGAHPRRAHFKHHPEGAHCYAATGRAGQGGEGAIHLTAKLHLRAQLERLRDDGGGDVRRELACPTCHKTYGGPLATVEPGDEIRVERRPPHQRDRYIPDLQVLRGDVPIFTVEVLYQHACDAEKWTALEQWPGAVVEVSTDHVLVPWTTEEPFQYLRAHHVRAGRVCASCTEAARHRARLEQEAAIEEKRRRAAAEAEAERLRLEEQAREAAWALQVEENRKRSAERAAQRREQERVAAEKWEAEETERRRRVEQDRARAAEAAEQQKQAEERAKRIALLRPLLSKIEAGQPGQFVTYACFNLPCTVAGRFRWLRFELQAAVDDAVLEVQLRDEDGGVRKVWTTDNIDRAPWLCDVGTDAVDVLRKQPDAREVPHHVEWILVQ